MRRNNYKNRSNSRNTVVFVALALSVLALLSAVFGIFTPRSATSGDNLGLFAWELGTISEEGKLKDSKESIRTKNMYAVKDMEIVIDDKSDITYDIAFYNEDEEFISVISGNTEDFDYEDATAVSEAKYFRVVITPVAEEDEEIKLTMFNMYKYIKQLTVSV